MNDSSNGAVLHELLDANATFALDAKGTTNHCPMALRALAGMGASPARLRAFFEMWRQRYAIIEPGAVAAIARADWKDHTGNAASFGALVRCFSDRIGDAGQDAVLREVNGGLPFAPATGAFHAIIRLAYGLEAGHAGEVAAGLAAYVSGYLPIEVALNGRAAAPTVDAGLAALSHAMHDRRFEGPSITGRLRGVAADPDFIGALSAPPLSTTLLDDMARAAIGIYWQTADFTALHMVTGLDAARSIFARLPACVVDEILPQLWMAFCAAYVSFGAPPLHAPEPIRPAMPWADLAAAAVESDNDHVIKMVYTCRREAGRTGSPLYAAAAMRLLRR